MWGVSGVSLARFTASWNFFSSRSDLFLSFSTDCRNKDSLRTSWSFMARAASSKSLKVFTRGGGVWAMTPWVAASTFSTAPQHGHATSKLAESLAIHEKSYSIRAERQDRQTCLV